MRSSLCLSLLAFVILQATQCGCDARRIRPPEREDTGGNERAKEYVRDESKPIVEVGVHDSRHRRDLACRQGERVLNFTLTTDRYGYETTFQWRTPGGIFASGPPEDENFDDLTTYTFEYCVSVGKQYILRMKDSGGDGLCCAFGRGGYSIRIDDETVYDSNRTRTFAGHRTHKLRVEAPLPPEQRPSNPNVPVAPKTPTTGCIRVEVRADKNAGELSWQILNANGREISRSPALKALEPVSKTVCLPGGRYEFAMLDGFGDGTCCGSGEGYFVVYLDGREIIRGGRFRFEKRYAIQVRPPYEDEMSDRDREWLVAHNVRRKKYHGEFGKSYVPLRWSPQLAAEAERWATKLLDDCHASGIRHEPGVAEGENLAKNKGRGKFGRQYPADSILSRWVERERNVGYPRNAHFTQCLWRSTKYVGCGEAAKTINGRGTCRFQVCRYSRAGNCAMASHQAYVGSNWMEPMLRDHTRCGPDCAPEGCY